VDHVLKSTSARFRRLLDRHYACWKSTSHAARLFRRDVRCTLVGPVEVARLYRLAFDKAERAAI